MIDATSHFVDVGGVRLHALESGGSGGETTVVLHGFTGSALSMESVAQASCDSEPVLRIDLVGHGRSAAPDSPAAYRMEACMAQVLAMVEALEIRRPHLVGYSMGGRVALSLCMAHPERFSSLLLIGASAGIDDSAARDVRRRADEALADRILAEGVEAFVDHWMALPLFASQRRLGAAALHRAREQRLDNRAAGLALSLRGMGVGAQPCVRDSLFRAALPVCLVVGEEDEKFRAVADDLVKRLPCAQIASIPRAGHAAHLENPRAFAQVVQRFRDEARAARGSAGG